MKHPSALLLAIIAMLFFAGITQAEGCCSLG
jgi:hypothetical protein